MVTVQLARAKTVASVTMTGRPRLASVRLVFTAVLHEQNINDCPANCENGGARERRQQLQLRVPSGNRG